MFVPFYLKTSVFLLFLVLYTKKQLFCFSLHTPGFRGRSNGVRQMLDGKG